MEAPLKIVIYYNHANTLGHSEIVLLLLKSIRRYIPGSKVLLFEGGRPPQALPMAEHAKVVTLPYALDKKGAVIAGVRSHRSVKSPGDMFKERQRLILNAVKSFRPDIFMVEHFPFGQDPWAFELPCILDYARRKIGSKVVGSIGYLNYVSRIYEHIERFFDRILIHTPRPLALTYMEHIAKKEATDLGRVLGDFEDKFDFTGFVLEKPVSDGVAQFKSGLAKKGFQKIVFVSRGGGIVNREMLVFALLSARKKKDWFFIVCCGPATTSRDLRACMELAKGFWNIQLISSLSFEKYSFYVTAADLCVNMSGYNTAVKLLYLRKRTVLIPRETSEQQWRALYMTKHIPAVILQEKEMSVDRLCRSMDEALRKPCPNSIIPPSWFNGAQQTARILSRLV